MECAHEQRGYAQAACLPPHLHIVFKMPRKHRLLRDPRHRQVQQGWKWVQVTLKLSNPRVLTAQVYTFSLNQNMLWTEKKKQWDSKKHQQFKNPVIFHSCYSLALATFTKNDDTGGKGEIGQHTVPSFSSSLLSRKVESVGTRCIYQDMT